MVPANLLYTEKHEWVKKEGNRVRVGITDFAQEELGDVVFVDLPAVGQRVSPQTIMMTIESIKAVSDLHAPLSGEVIEVNDDLQHNPEWVNQDPYKKGWIAIIEFADEAEFKGLLTAEKYAKHLNNG